MGWKNTGGLTSIDRTKLNNIESPIKSNLTASRAPNADDDVDLGYSVGSLWVHNGTTYNCVKNTDGAAEWTNITDIYYFDTWTAMLDEVTNAANGSKYLNKYLNVSNGNGGHKSGVYTHGTTTIDPIADGNPVVYVCTTSAGATASLTVKQRPAPPFRVSRIYNVAGATRPTTDGYYIFTAAPASGYPVGGANDIVQLSGTTWTLYQTYANAPTTIQVGAASNTTRAVDKSQGGWANIVCTDDMTTTAELLAAVNAAGAPVRVTSNKNVSLTATDGTFTPAVIFENADRLTFTASSAVTLTFDGRVTMRGGGTFTKTNCIFKGAGTIIAQVRFNACWVQANGSDSIFSYCEFFPGASYAGAYLFRFGANKVNLEYSRFDVQGNSLASLNCITRETAKDCNHGRVFACQFWSDNVGKANSCIYEASDATRNWNYMSISDNYAQIALETGFIHCAASTPYKFYWVVANNQCEFYDRTTNSGNSFNWLFCQVAWGWRVHGNNVANCPVSAVCFNNSFHCVINGNVFHSLNVKEQTSKWAVLFTNTCRCMVASNNSIQTDNAKLERTFWLSNTRGAVISGNQMTYANNKTPSTIDFVYGGSDSENVNITGNNCRTGGAVTTFNWMSSTIGGTKYQSANIYDTGTTY